MFLDAVESFAYYALREPQQIDFSAIERAASDAAYDITEIHLELNGNVVERTCSDCDGAARSFLHLETGQELELRGLLIPDGAYSFRGMVVGWKTRHPYLWVAAPSLFGD